MFYPLPRCTIEAENIFRCDDPKHVSARLRKERAIVDGFVISAIAQARKRGIESTKISGFGIILVKTAGTNTRSQDKLFPIQSDHVKEIVLLPQCDG